jgi:anti-sigma factor RsiW
MTSEECRPWRELLGAYALGHLAADERIALEAHVDGCAACTEELEELRPVARALPAADPGHLGARPAPPADLADRVAARIRVARKTQLRRRWRLGVAAVAAAAIVAITTLAVSNAMRSGGRSEREEFAFAVLPAGVQATAFLYPPAEGTLGVEVWLEVDGLEPGGSYAVWVERVSTGDRVKCGTFEAVAGEAHIVLPSIVDRADTGAVGVSTAAGEFVMRAPVT